MATVPSLTVPARPAVDEWGVYDPEQAGLSAVFLRLATTPRPPATSPERAEAQILGEAAIRRPLVGDPTR
jgi:hypothetical protein